GVVLFLPEQLPRELDDAALQEGRTGRVRRYGRVLEVQRAVEDRDVGRDRALVLGLAGAAAARREEGRRAAPGRGDAGGTEEAAARHRVRREALELHETSDRVGWWTVAPLRRSRISTTKRWSPGSRSRRPGACRSRRRGTSS